MSSDYLAYGQSDFASALNLGQLLKFSKPLLFHLLNRLFLTPGSFLTWWEND